jgi:hypothetical protein
MEQGELFDIRKPLYINILRSIRRANQVGAEGLEPPTSWV